MTIRYLDPQGWGLGLEGLRVQFVRDPVGRTVATLKRNIEAKIITSIPQGSLVELYDKGAQNPILIEAPTL